MPLTLLMLLLALLVLAAVLVLLSSSRTLVVLAVPVRELVLSSSRPALLGSRPVGPVLGLRERLSVCRVL